MKHRQAPAPPDVASNAITISASAPRLPHCVPLCPALPYRADGCYNRSTWRASVPPTYEPPVGPAPVEFGPLPLGAQSPPGPLNSANEPHRLCRILPDGTCSTGWFLVSRMFACY